MVMLFEQNIRTNDRQSSKGNQLKWENNGIWYKADYTGYEGLAEYVISQLLIKSTLREDEYVKYSYEIIKYKEIQYNGVKSDDFLKGDWQLITLERLYKQLFVSSLYKTLYAIDDIRERLFFLVNQVEYITGLKDFGKYINKLFTLDALFLNEDRHTHNIAVLMNGEGKFDFCPIFDNGAGLLSDTTMDYPLGEDVYSLIKSVKSKTICSDFDEQLDLSEMLYGHNLTFSFTKKNVAEIVSSAEIYSEAERKRIEEIIYLQMQKYQYLFK